VIYLKLSSFFKIEKVMITATTTTTTEKQKKTNDTFRLPLTLKEDNQ